VLLKPAFFFASIFALRFPASFSMPHLTTTMSSATDTPSTLTMTTTTSPTASTVVTSPSTNQERSVARLPPINDLGIPGLDDDLIAMIPVVESSVWDDSFLDDWDLDELPPDLRSLLKEGEGDDDEQHDFDKADDDDDDDDPNDTTATTEASTGDHPSLSFPIPCKQNHRLRIDYGRLNSEHHLSISLPCVLHRSAAHLSQVEAITHLGVSVVSAPAALQTVVAQARMRVTALVSDALRAGQSVDRSDSNYSHSFLSEFSRELADGEDQILDRFMNCGTLQDDELERILQGDPTASLRQPRPPCGLANLGNTCFVNAALQALAHCTPFTTYMLQGLFALDVGSQGPAGCIVALVYAAVLHNLFGLAEGQCSSTLGPGGRCFAPMDFMVVLSRFQPYLATGEMQDSQELLAWLLGALNEDLNRAGGANVVGLDASPLRATSPCLLGMSGGPREEERHAAEAWFRHLHTNRSIVVDLFQGQLRSQLRCPSCKIRSVVFDPFLYLALPLPARPPHGVVSLDELVRHLCSEECLDAANLWVCPNCGEHVEARKKLDLWKLPPILMVHLKRTSFVQEGHCVWTRKLNCLVEFPQERFDFRPLLPPETIHKDPQLYDLIAVVDHLGGTVDSGHYTATCRRPDGWWEFNDSHAKYLGAGANVVSNKNYVLIMERRSAPTEPHAIDRQLPNEPHAWPHLIDVDWSFLIGEECSFGG